MGVTRFPCALTIAGSDSSGGAGIQADLKTFAAFEVYGASVLTAVTAQNTSGVRAVHALPTEIIAAQLDAVLDDLPISAVKIGMLSSADIVQLVAERLLAHNVRTIVLDPVMTATSGNALLQDNAVAALIRHLLPMATVLTPNIPEAARLLGLPSLANTEAAARDLFALGPSAVLLKGGHGQGDLLEDILVLGDGSVPFRFQHARHATVHTHGTGCSLSSAITAGLACGLSIPQATAQAITWLQEAIAHAWPLGHGHGPVHHFWRTWRNME